MARGRVINPDFWSDGNMVGVSPFARLFYIGMWNHAHCDRGHLDDDVMGLKLKILPADQVDPQGLLDELMGRERVLRLRSGQGKTFLWMPTFARWQKADPRWKTRCPACALINSGELTETQESLVEHTKTLPISALREEKRTRENQREENQTVAVSRDDVSSLCNLLADLVEANGSKRPTITAAWNTEARLLLDKDGHELDKALNLIRWVQANPFWRGNVMSMPKFRAKYDQLRLAAVAEHKQRAGEQSRTEKNLSIVHEYAAQEQGAITQ